MRLCGLVLGVVTAFACATKGEKPAAKTAAAPAVAPAPAPTATPARPPAAQPLSEDIATPYFRDGVAGEAAERFALEDWAGARTKFAAYLAGPDAPTDDAGRARVRLLIALCDAQLGSFADAAAGFDIAEQHLPLIAELARFHGARARYFAGDLDGAAERAAKVSTESRWYAEAQLLIGDVLRQQQRWQDMTDHYARYLADRKRGPRLAEATFRLAQAHDELGRRVPDAIALYRRITIFDPLSPWAERAQTRVDELLDDVPRADRARYATMTGSEYIERGKQYYHAMRNTLSAADFAAARKDRSLSQDERCVAAYHEANSWWKERKRTRSAPLFDLAIAECDKTDNTELRVKSAYQAGRSYARLGEPKKAIARYALVEQFDHSYADDARMRQAEEYRDLDEQDKVTELLSTLPDKYPDGDMRAEATWRLAWRAYKNKDYAEAIRWLDKQIELVPYDTHWYGAGQAQYWLGRSYAHLGKTAESIASYEACVRTYPLSYYSMLALNRLRESHPSEFAALTKEIATPPEGFDPSQPAFSFRPRALWGSEGFRRGIELLKLGLGEDAVAELSRVGLGAPPGRDEVTDDDERDKLWAFALLFDRAGRYDLSHWPTRWHIIQYQRSWPVGHNRARWRIAYPMAFSYLIEPQAAKHGYPMALQMGIMREESAFDPLRESWANAIGLTQMIKSTATRFSKGTGIAPTRENLRDPQKNVVIGSNFLGFLHGAFEGRVGLMIPSYNAGEGATWRWMYQRHSPEWSRDEFEEEIPGDQARNYTKRVLASYFVYAYMADGTIPEMPQEVPTRLIPDRIKKKLRRRFGPL